MSVVIPSFIASAIEKELACKLSVPTVHKTANGKGVLKIQGNRIVIIIDSDEKSDSLEINQQFAVLVPLAEEMNNLYNALVPCYVYDPSETYYQAAVKITDKRIHGSPNATHSLEIVREGDAVSIRVVFKDQGSKTFYLSKID